MKEISTEKIGDKIWFKGDEFIFCKGEFVNARRERDNTTVPNSASQHNSKCGVKICHFE